MTNRIPTSQLSNFVYHFYDIRPNWIPFSPVTITKHINYNFFFIFCFNNGLWIYYYSKGVETENTSSCFSKRQWTIIQWQCSNHGMFESSCESYFLCVWESLHPDTFVGLLLALYWYSLGTIFICKKHLKSLWKFKSFQYIVFTYFFKWFLKLTCQKKMNICIGSRVLAADCKSRLQSL